MALEIYFCEDLERSIVAAVALTLSTSDAGRMNVDYVAGVVAMARYQSLNYGVNWKGVVGQVRASLGVGLNKLLDGALGTLDVPLDERRVR